MSVHPSSGSSSKKNIQLHNVGSLLPHSHSQSMQHQRVELEHQRARQRHNVHVLFLEAQPNDHILNRLTAMLGKRVHKVGSTVFPFCGPWLSFVCSFPSWSRGARQASATWKLLSQTQTPMMVASSARPSTTGRL